MNLFEQNADNPAQAIEEEISAAIGCIEELTVQLADIEEKLGEARNKTERLKDDLQNPLAKCSAAARTPNNGWPYYKKRRRLRG